MKKYVKNKDFLPNAYIEKMNLKIQKRERIDCIILFAIVMIFLPHTIDIVINQKQNRNIENDYINNDKGESINDYEVSKNESLNNSVEYLNSIIEGDLSNGNGELFIQGKARLADYINDKKIIINTIEDLGEDKYRIEISEK